MDFITLQMKTLLILFSSQKKEKRFIVQNRGVRK